MSATLSLHRAFAPVVRRRGEKDFEEGAVHLEDEGTESLSASVSAAVRGGRRYHVNVIVREQQLGASCDCAAYKAGVYCQHIWATLRAVESRHTTASGKKAEPPAGEHLTLTDLATMSLPQPGGWRDALDRLARDAEFAHEAPWHEQPDVEVELAYRIDVAATLRGQRLAVEIGERRRPAGGEWGELEASELRAYEIADLPDPLDREILAMLLGAEPESGPGPSRYTLTEPLRGLVLPALCRTGRCRLLLASGEESGPLRWEPEEWQFWMAVTIDRKSDEFAIAGALRRGRKRCALSKPILLLSGGLAFFPDRIAPLDDSGAFRWIGELRRAGTLRVPRREADRLLRALLAAPRTRPRLKLPAQLRFEELRLPPVPVLSARARLPGRSGRPLECELGFDYGGVLIEFGAPGWAVWHGGGRRLLVRDEEKERAATAILAELDLRPASVGKGSWAVPVRRFAEVVRTLVSKGWRVRADGHDYLAASGFDLRVASGIDWFDLEGGASFGDGRTIAIPRLLKALNSGELAVELDDGSLGLVPEQWLAQHALLADFAEVADDRLRFRRNQVALLDALLASQPEANTDRAFRRARAALDRFDGVGPVDPTPGFVGKLRDYQREGLGWMHFLRDFGFGGCLADDMGLGKTVQVLALLEGRRSAKATGRSRRKPSLVVVPRSLVFNWKQEAERFAPRLRVLDHTGPDRAQKKAALDGWDVVLTTYGTLRRDALLFRDARFDYAILDEAQAIKNPRTASAKAARLLTAEHRLVLSGTPIENHLGELWSLFEFLNPGMLGRAAILTPGSLSEPDEQQRALLARALKPFILRRTKDKVARDLPPRTEQTLYCEPGPEQRQMCDELREHYRHQLMVQIDSRGLGRSKIKILEALLRMRQAACHPGLLDPALQAAPSAKLDVLLPRLVEVLDEGHKALVFSQFTSFLAILRKRLDEQGLPYEYLDGRTRDRAARVQRFQEDPKCPLFLISLKAGGLGLNLTAAEYVFLLDPWWNPAAEAQAVDRTHRIGQHRHVFAYRLITRDTIEERVLELQKRKRSLADAILTADEGMLRGLERADLEELLR